MRNKINGGSVRCFVTHEKNTKFDTKKDHNKIKNLLTKEKKIKINSEYPYKKFVKRINKIKKQTTDLLKNLKNKNKEIHIYGASTKGNTILQWYGIDKKLIKYAADRNNEKWGTHTIGSKINIISDIVNIGSNINKIIVTKDRSIISEKILIIAIIIKVKLFASESIFFVKKEEFVFI